MVNLIFTIIGAILLAGGLGSFAVLMMSKYKSIPWIEKYHLDVRKTLWISLGSFGISIIGFVVTTICGILLGHEDLSLLNAPLTFIFGILSLTFLYGTFFVKYLLDKQEFPTWKKWLKIAWGFGIFFFLLSIVYLVEGVVEYISYPMNKNLISIGGLHVAYYAVLIIIGALIAYGIGVKKLSKLGYRKDIIESLFYVAFPAGIVGARIWYVISQWNTEFGGAGYPFSKVFEIWNGGLAIEGGALVGAIAGILFVHYRRKELPVFLALDLIVPGILIAQAIGRWGNFVNNEVFGMNVLRSDWAFLPQWILNQMACNNGTNPALLEGEIHVPLFLIEGLLNVAGYFFLTYVVGKLLKKWTVPGDVALGYLIWYGTVRAILEPMRNPAYIMDKNISVWMSIAFVIVGVLGVVVVHLLHWKRVFKRDQYDDIMQNGYHPAEEKANAESL